MENNSLKEALALIDLLDFTMESAITLQASKQSNNTQNGSNLTQINNNSIPFLGIKSILNSLRAELVNIQTNQTSMSINNPSNIATNSLAASSSNVPLETYMIQNASQESQTGASTYQAVHANPVGQAPVRVKTIPQEARGRVRELVGYSELEE